MRGISTRGGRRATGLPATSKGTRASRVLTSPTDSNALRKTATARGSNALRKTMPAQIVSVHLKIKMHKTSSGRSKTVKARGNVLTSLPATGSRASLTGSNKGHHKTRPTTGPNLDQATAKKKNKK